MKINLENKHDLGAEQGIEDVYIKILKDSGIPLETGMMLVQNF